MKKQLSKSIRTEQNNKQRKNLESVDSALKTENEYRNSTFESVNQQVNYQEKSFEYSLLIHQLTDVYPFDDFEFHDEDIIQLKVILDKENGFITNVDLKAYCSHGGKRGEKADYEVSDDEKQHFIQPYKAILRREGVSYSRSSFNFEMLNYGDSNSPDTCPINIKITYMVPV